MKQQLEQLPHEKLGDVMHKTSINYINQWGAFFSKHEDCDTADAVKKATRLPFTDASDLYAIGTLLKKGQVSQAKNLAWSLDTIVRDEIPDDVWDFLKAGYKEL